MSVVRIQTSLGIGKRLEINLILFLFVFFYFINLEHIFILCDLVTQITDK